MLLPIRTDRLTLRALTADDAVDHRRLYGDPRVVRYLYEEPQDSASADEHLRRRLVAELPDEGSWLNLAVENDGRYLGEVGLCLVSRAHRQCEVGYVFLPEASGHGYATEATAAMVELAFAELDAHRVAGRLDARNEASARVLARLGMRREACLRENEFVKGEWTDEVVYAITEDEWRARASSD
jgi:RimJ/RimL family protein N-acetyltransferase